MILASLPGYSYADGVSGFQFEDLSPWASRVVASGLPDYVNAILATLDEREAADTTEQDHVGRIRRVVEAAASAVSSVDSALLADSTINQLASQLAQIQAHLANWASGSGLPELANATSQADAATTTISYIPLPPSAAAASAEVAFLRRSVGQHRGQVDREIEDLRIASSNAQQSFSTSADRASVRIAEIEQEVARLREEINQALSTVREQANQQQNAFSSAQDLRQSAFSSLSDEARAQLRQETEELAARFAATATEYAELQQGHVEEAASAKQRIEEILGIVGEEALVGTYSKNSGEERRQANFWRWVSISFVSISVLIGAWIVSSTADAGSDWDHFAAKSLLVLPIAAAAAYAAKQSGEHRHTQREAEHMALQLAALGPYLSDLTDISDRDRLLSEVAQRFFGQPRRTRSGESDAGDAPTTINQITQLLQEVAKLQR